LHWAEHVIYTLRKTCKALHVILLTLKKGNKSRKRLVYTVLVGPLLECRAICWDPYREGQISALNRVRKKAVKFANNINESGWETLAQRRLIARICALFKAYIGGRAWNAIWDKLLNHAT